MIVRNAGDWPKIGHETGKKARNKGAERSRGKQNAAGLWPLPRSVDLVGARGFEPPTTCTPCRYATRLRYAPRVEIIAEVPRWPRSEGGFRRAAAPADFR